MGWSAHYVVAEGREGERMRREEGRRTSKLRGNQNNPFERARASVCLSGFSLCLLASFPLTRARSAIERLNPDKLLL